ncbi:hypothetical protein GOODEAATRI_026796 [Goodea atripinnis]|uniref:Uncharacterized protein n=1 Tax=Goodea atripinnis TaxID=208336 RepID=A0ABV0MXH1_9TELE
MNYIELNCEALLEDASTLKISAFDLFFKHTDFFILQILKPEAILVDWSLKNNNSQLLCPDLQVLNRVLFFCDRGTQCLLLHGRCPERAPSSATPYTTQNPPQRLLQKKELEGQKHSDMITFWLFVLCVALRWTGHLSRV